MEEMGLLRSVYHVMERLPDRFERLRFLHERFPNTSLQTRQAALQRLTNAYAQAIAFTRSGIHPNLSDLARDPTHEPSGRFSYHVEATARGFEGGRTRGGPSNLFTRFTVIYSDVALNAGELEQRINEFMLAQQKGQGSPGTAFPNTRITSVAYHVVSITRAY